MWVIAIKFFKISFNPKQKKDRIDLYIINIWQIKLEDNNRSCYLNKGCNRAVSQATVRLEN